MLRRTLVQIDSRHGIKPPDADMMKMLDEAAVGYRLVLTKADKVKASELAATLAAVEAEARKHPAAYPKIHVTSAEKGMGIAELRAAILADAET
jgi:GTP-binding protein